MNTTQLSPEVDLHDSLLAIAKDIGPPLEGYVDEDENNRRLSPEVVRILRDAGLYRLFLPKELGGWQCDPLIVAKVMEEIARHHTAAAWSLMVANTASWWCNRFSEKGIEEIFKQGRDTFMAGAFHPPMSVTETTGGYILNGRSPLASNIHEADWIFVTAMVMENGQLKLTNGMPEILGVCMKTSECEILDTWYTLGMKASDSNDIEASNVFIPSARAYFLTPQFTPNKYFQDDLYRIPAICASIAALIAPICLALATNAIRELQKIAEKKVPMGSSVTIKGKGTVQSKLGIAEACVQSSRAYLYHQISDVWNKTQMGHTFSLKERADLLLAVTHTNQSCLKAVELMYSAGGTSGIYLKNKLSHYFADAEVIRHHGFSNESRYETAGQMYFNLQPDFPVVLF